MKNIVIIDGALNSRLEIYTIDNDRFSKLFPTDIDEIYVEDLDEALQEDVEFWDHIYANEVDRQKVQGIHGIVHTHPRAKTSVLESLS